MRHSSYIVYLIMTILLSCTAGKSLFGSYKGDSDVWGYSIDLMPDSTFVYKFRAHLSSDSATGFYSVKGDSISIRISM